MARAPQRRFLALATLAVLGAGACNKELQGQADVLIAALEDGDYAKVETVASESLLADMTESRFADFALTYDELGEMTDKTRTGTGINGEQKTVRYKLDFAEGDVELIVVSNSDKLDGFELRGPAWNRAQVDRHHGALEKLLAAARAGDQTAARALVHPSIGDGQLGETVTSIGKLGEHKPLAVHDEAIPEFRIEFAGKAFIGSVRLSGASIIGYSFRPADPAPPS